MNNNHIGFKFAMPCNETMEIIASKPIPEGIELDQEIENVVYNIWWDDISLPWCTRTQQEAIFLAIGVQWGAKKMFERMNK